MTTQKHFVKTALRLPPDLHSSLHETAKESERTFNAEILHRLRSTLKGKRTRQPSGDRTPTDIVTEQEKNRERQLALQQPGK